MKQRLLVMNGQRIVQNATEDGGWKTEKNDKAGDIRPGIFNMSSAITANKFVKHDGPILHIDEKLVYQGNGKQITKHEKRAFEELPEIGKNRSINYDDKGKAVASELAATTKLTKSRSR